MNETPLSRAEGVAREPRDFHWLERNIPCQAACPAQTDIPGYLAAVSQGDFEGAYRINLADNVFPGVLGRVCARPCEPPCRHGWPGLGEPVAICFSKRAAAGHRAPREAVVLSPVFPATGKKVAVVGAGVAGLTVARQLVRLGHEVVVYERHERPGGMMRQGIPAFRLPRDVVDSEIRQVEAAGVRIACGVNVGGDVSVEQLLADHDAVVLAAGTLRPNIPKGPGVSRKGVEHGLEFLLSVNELGRRDIGRRVAVIGGGFTAIDCARVALRLGAEKVGVFYRRSADDMRVTPGELEEMAEEGIPLETQVAPVAFDGDAGGVRSVRFIRTRPGEPDADGRRRPVEIPGSEFAVEADLVLLATGQQADRSWAPALASPKLFLAGDYATGATTLIEAIGHARQITREVDAALMGGSRVEDVVRIESGREVARTRAMDAVPRQPMPGLPVDARKLEAEVETGLPADRAREEAGRCYLCHYKYEIDMDRCIYCDQCVEVKPRPDCIVKARALRKDGEGRITGWDRRDEHLLPGTPPFLYWIHQEDCIRCNACLEVCPVKCISVQKVSRREAAASA
ncbi:MAG TPA: FAD-dependent oxidoreductase [Kiritimatiellia bacterium]|nr:FAD-dependent oxidoreductase [Kiritimatiellia bacterium]HRZ12276.1 FAD-dependent oxidoreductase [Kiritimatiellia bacterium]HSA17966.1 FAD-dependent oxidoreductase [Kiritimatiellia bacterium]